MLPDGNIKVFLKNGNSTAFSSKMLSTASTGRRQDALDANLAYALSKVVIQK